MGIFHSIFDSLTIRHKHKNAQTSSLSVLNNCTKILKDENEFQIVFIHFTHKNKTFHILLCFTLKRVYLTSNLKLLSSQNLFLKRGAKKFYFKWCQILVLQICCF